VWRLALFGRVLASVIALAPAAAAVAAVIQTALHPSRERLAGALVTVGVAVFCGLALWWMAPSASPWRTSSR